MTPNEIEYIPEKLTKLFRGLQLDILNDIIQRISKNREITSIADWEIKRLYELGTAKEVIKRSIQRALRLSAVEIDYIYSTVLMEDYVRYEPIYKRLGKSFIPFKENKQLQQLIGGIEKQTKGELENITQSLGFAVKQLDGSVKFTPLSKGYQQILDKAMMSLTTGVYNYNTVIKKAVVDLSNSGLRTIEYATEQPTGVTTIHSNRVDVAARRALMTGFNQVVGKITEDNAERLGAEYFEVTWHRGARPTHQPWQGRVYTKEQLVSVCGYGDVAGLKGANCRHDFNPFFPGLDKRTYTDEQLDRLNAEENTPREYGGKEYTVYEATQRQRKLESRMRIEREKIALLESGGADDETIDAKKAHYHAISSEYSKFSKAMKLPQQRERVNIGTAPGVDVTFGA